MTTYFTYDFSGNVLTTETATERREYVWVVGKQFARIDTDLSTTEETIAYLVTDHLGSVTLATDGSAATIWNAEYSPFGDILGDVDEASTLDYRAYTGKLYDDDTG